MEDGNSRERIGTPHDDGKFQTQWIAERCMQLGNQLLGLHSVPLMNSHRQLRVLLLQAHQIFLLLRHAWEEAVGDDQENFHLLQHGVGMHESVELESVQIANKELQLKVQSLQHQITDLEASLEATRNIESSNAEGLCDAKEDACVIKQAEDSVAVTCFKSCEEQPDLIDSLSDDCAGPQLTELYAVAESDVQMEDTISHHGDQSPVLLCRLNQKMIVYCAPSLNAPAVCEVHPGTLLLCRVTENPYWLELAGNHSAEGKFLRNWGIGITLIFNLQYALDDKVTHDYFDLREVSGGGPSSTFVVKHGLSSCVVKIYKETFLEVSRARISAVINLFASRNLGPRQISEGSFWSIHEFAGSDLRVSFASMQEVAQLLAKVHNLPTEWFDDQRRLINEWWCTLNNKKNELQEGSHLWWHLLVDLTFVKDAFILPDWTALDWKEKARMAMWMYRTSFYPSSPAAKRVVTCHGDFHMGNIVRTASGNLACIDLELSCVTFAVHDIAILFEVSVRDPQNRYDFAKAYLLARGEKADEAAIEDLIFQARCYRAGFARFAREGNIKYEDSAIHSAIEDAKEQTENIVLRDAIINGTLEDAANIWAAQQRSK